MTTDQGYDQHFKVLAISGSLRRASFNSGLLRAAQEVAPDGMEINIFDIKGLPFYDGDLEAQGDPESVTALKLAVRESDASDSKVLKTPLCLVVLQNGGTEATVQRVFFHRNQGPVGQAIQ